MRAWPASQARAGFSPVKRALGQHCGSVVVIFIVTSLVLVATCNFLLERAVRERLSRESSPCYKRFVVNLYLFLFLLHPYLLHAARLFHCGASAGPLCMVVFVLVSPRPPWPRAKARIRARRLYA